MLYLNRRAGEAVILNNAIEVRVVEVRGKTVRLGFSFPPEVSVLREEVFLQIREGNEAAARTAASLLARPGRGMSTPPATPPLVAVVMGSSSDWATMRHAVAVLDELGVAQRGADRLRAPHARAAVRLRQGCARRGLQGDRRRRRRGGAPARHDRLADHPARAGRAGREQGAGRARQPLLDRPDAGRRAGRHAGDRQAGCDQRGPARGLDPGPGRPGAGRRAGRAGAQRQTEAVAETPGRRRRREPDPARRDDRHPGRRPARPHDGHGGGPARLSLPRPRARGRQPGGRRRGRLHLRRLRRRGGPGGVRRRRRRGHARVRERAGRGARLPGRALPGPPERRRAAGHPGPAGREGLRRVAGLPGHGLRPRRVAPPTWRAPSTRARPGRAQDHAPGLRRQGPDPRRCRRPTWRQRWRSWASRC